MTKNDALQVKLQPIDIKMRVTPDGALYLLGENVAGKFVYEGDGVRAVLSVTLSESALRDLTPTSLPDALAECCEVAIAELILKAGQARGGRP